MNGSKEVSRRRKSQNREEAKLIRNDTELKEKDRKRKIEESRMKHSTAATAAIVITKKIRSAQN